MAKLTLQQTLDKSLKTAKQYVDTELAKKANTHDHNYLPLTGGSVSGAITSTIGGGKAGFIIRNGTSRTMMYASTVTGEHIFGGCNDSTDQVKDFVRIGASKLKYETGGASYDIYHSGNKPSLSALGAASSGHGHTNMVQGDNTSRTTDQNGNANDLAASGFYRVSNTNSTSNPLPGGMHAHILHGQHPNTAGYKYQIAVPYSTTNKLYFRNNPNDSWGDWHKIYHSGDKPTPADIGAAKASHGTHLTLGTGSSNAYRGDLGNTAYQHSQAAHAPSNAQKNSDITKTEIENKLTGTISSHTHDYITSMDTRSANSAPNTYTTRGIYPEFKSTSTVGLPNSGKNFAGVITYQQWGDTTSWSGGKATQFATLDDGRMYFRKGEGTSWGAWNRFYTNLHKPDLDELGAAPASHGTHLTIGTGAGNAAAGNHTHKYAGSSSAGGAANNSEKFGGYSLWVGTQAQYDAISSKSSTTIYIIK